MLPRNINEPTYLLNFLLHLKWTRYIIFKFLTPLRVAIAFQSRGTHRSAPFFQLRLLDISEQCLVFESKLLPFAMKMAVATEFNLIIGIMIDDQRSIDTDRCQAESSHSVTDRKVVYRDL